MSGVDLVVGEAHTFGRAIVLVIEIDRVAYLAFSSELVHDVVVDRGTHEVKLEEQSSSLVKGFIVREHSSGFFSKTDVLLTNEQIF